MALSRTQKGAALVGTASAAAAAGAFTYNRGGETNMSLELAIGRNKDAVFNYFNEPSDCIKRTFPKIEEQEFIRPIPANSRKGFFNKPQSVSSHPLNGESDLVNHKKVVFNAESQVAVPDFACLIYNNSETFFRIEIVLKKGNEGWSWSAAINDPNAPFRYLFYREAVFQKQEGTEDWKVVVGHDGKINIGTQRTLNDLKPVFTKDVFPYVERGIDEHAGCKDSETYCEVNSVIGVWIPDEDSYNTFLDYSTVQKFSLAFEDANIEKRNIRGARYSIYKDGEWYADTHDSKKGTAKRELIVFNKSNILDQSKGRWMDLKEFCKAGVRDKNGAYSSYCY